MLSKTDFEIEINNGAALLNAGNPAGALERFRPILKQSPHDPLANYNAAVAYYAIEDFSLAVHHYKMAIAQAPHFAAAHHNLGRTLQRLGKTPEAIESFSAALGADPSDYKSAHHLGLIYHAQGNSQKAEAAYQFALHANPDSADVFCALGMLYLESNRFDESHVCLEQALSICPNMSAAHFNQGLVHQKTGAFETALLSYKNAMTLDPHFAQAHWLYHLALPLLYESPDQIKHYRNRFAVELDHLVESIKLDTVEDKAFALALVGTSTNFFLQYQGQNDLELQCKYGHLVQRVMSSNYPEWSQPKRMPPLDRHRKIRIGYVSTYMCDHTVGTFLSGWLDGHDLNRFEIHCFHIGKKVDAVTHRIRNTCHSFCHTKGDLLTAAAQITAADLHILIHTDIGMDPLTLQLAGLRLAPIQCKGWGHPVTTGLDTIDYYLSSDLMEPEDAQDHYSEKLVRLPNLALFYSPPDLPDDTPLRHRMQLPEDRFIYLSTQSIYKYLPQHDDIFPRIALEVPHAYFVFIRHQSLRTTDQFRRRLQTAFKRHGMDADDYCHFSERLSFHDFLKLNLAADVLLDTLEWSGGKTTLEAIGCGLPVVTLPGPYMRGRHAYAMLRLMDMESTIATSKSNYCRIAVRLARDPSFFDMVKQHIVTHRHKLYQDRRFIKALEQFYCSIVDAHLQSAGKPHHDHSGPIQPLQQIVK